MAVVVRLHPVDRWTEASGCMVAAVAGGSRPTLSEGQALRNQNGVDGYVGRLIYSHLTRPGAVH
jgi:hypothetical protein